jgi:hypothetical protein
MTLDRVCDEIEQKGFSKREKFEERKVCGWVGGYVCVVFFFGVARINGEILAQNFLYFLNICDQNF